MPISGHYAFCLYNDNVKDLPMQSQDQNPNIPSRYWPALRLVRRLVRHSYPSDGGSPSRLGEASGGAWVGEEGAKNKKRSH